MVLSTVELERIDAELDALAAGLDLEGAWSRVRPAGADLAGVDAALATLGSDLPVVIERPRTTARASVARTAKAEPVEIVEVEPVAEPPARATEEPMAAFDAVEVVEVAEVVAAPVARPVEVQAEVEEAVVSAEALLNPFEEPAGDASDDEDRTLIIDASELGGLDMDALFDGMVEEALSAPLEDGGLSGPILGRVRRPSTSPPPVEAGPTGRVEGATDIEQLRPDGEDDLELFVEDDAIGLDADEALEALETSNEVASAQASDDPEDGAPKKKGFFKKLFG